MILQRKNPLSRDPSKFVEMTAVQEGNQQNKQIEATSHLVHLSLKVAFLKKPAEDNMNPSHSETTQQSLEMKKERATRKKHKRVDMYIG